MGSAASEELAAAVAKASPSDLATFFRGLSASDRRKLSEALAAAETETNPAVKAMEVAIAFSPEDYRAHVSSLDQPPAGAELCQGFPYAGSFAGRNIEKIYAKAEAAGSPCCLSSAVRACFDRKLRHVLVCSGFYVLHSKGGNDGKAPGVAAGSCETDGPLGALALLRAFAARGVCVSLFCEPHTGPVLKAGYDAMLRHFEGADAAFAAQLKKFSRCLPDAVDGSAEDPTDEFKALYAKIFQDDSTPAPTALRCRMLRCCSELAKAVSAAWGNESPGSFDCLFALERLGAPYRNIRGKDIGEHTEPIDCLWPLVTPHADSAAAKAVKEYCNENSISADDTKALREVAGVASNALTLGIGDGGNEVGMGKVVLLEGIAELSPGGEFAALSVNGTYRTCDHAIVATVSNWGGTAFEMAAHLLSKPEVDYLSALTAKSKCIADVEDEILKVIMAEPVVSVDGKYNDMPHSVDGMAFQPHHKEFYDYLWQLATK